MGHKKSIGLRGGPNEYITDISEFVSIEGYKRNSPDVNNPVNIIESSSITMEGVDFPVMGTDNLGNSQIMTPGNNYQFPGDQVFEIPMAKRGGGLLNKTMECNSCGWSWKAADGGADVSTCHKCGGSALPKAQDGTEVEEKSVWGLVKEMAKVPGANISNILGVMGIPANLIAEATESLTGRGDGEFNFMDAIPSFATPGSDDEIFTFTNQNDTPVKNVAGLEDADGNPLVENPVGAFITNLATDPSTYVGAGVAKNVINKVTQKGLKRGLRKTIAKNIPRKVKTPIEGTDMVMTTNSKIGQLFDKTGIPKMLWPKGFNYGADEAGKSFVATANNASGDIIDLSKYADEAGDYFTFDNAFVKNPMTAGRSMKAMEKSIPKYGVIKQNPLQGSLSEDSFTMMLQRLKDGKRYKDVTNYGENVFLNRSGKNRIVKPGPTNQMLVNQNLFDASEVAALNTKYGKVFDKLKNRGVLNDEFRGFGTREIKIPGLADKVYQVGVPNIGVQKLYQVGGEQPKTWKDIEINKEGLKRAIAEVESINGVLMINPESTATGLYGQRFSELEEGKLYEGTRDEFAKDLEAQNRIFDMRLNEGIKSNRTTPLLKDAFDLTNEYKEQLGDKWNYSYEDLITLSNFLGRGGTREFLGNVIRDGKTLEEVYPTKFGKGAKQSNKTPYEYLEKTRDYYQRGREVREIAQDNTRVVKPRIYDIEPQIENKGDNFLSNPDLDYDPLNNERTEIARDNTYVSGFDERNNKILANLVNNPQSDKVNLDEVMNSLEEAEEFDSREYDDPVLIADFIKNSNFYSDGWKDMSNATEDEVLDLQNVLVKKGYDVGLTGVDGKYGDRTYEAHKAMVDDNNLEPNVISRYYKNYKEDTKQEVKSIQEKLIDAGYLDDTLFNSNKSSVDGKFGDQTKIALDAYNTDNVEEDPQGEVFNNIPSTLEEERCAAGMCTILEGNEVLTEALGVKYKDAWDLSESMINANNSKEIYNIYTNPAFKNINENTSTDELKKTTRKVKKNSQTKASDYKVGDIVGLYWDGSSHHGETLESETYNTHSGFVSAIDEDGVPIITHNVAGDVRQQPYSELTTAWIRRPDENIKVNSTYDTLDIDTVAPDELAINNLGIRYQTNYQENPERLNQIETIFQRAKYNAQKIPKILNSSVDPEWLESVVIGITGVESGVGNSAPRTVEEARSGKRGLQGIGYDLIGKTDGSISLGIGKRKFNGLDPFAKKYFQINSVEDLADDSKSVDAITYGITKSYETFKDYAKQYPELGLTEEDIRNMSILSYNQGENRLLQTGRVDDERTPQEEVEELRELYDAMVTDVSSTNYRFLNKTGLPIGDIAYNTALSIGAEQASPSYINKVNQYIEDLFPTQIAMTQTEDPFRNSVLARGGEYGVYNNYMTGKYDGTPREKHAMNLYDKLNRVHYKDAKKANMSSPNYIMSHIYKA